MKDLVVNRRGAGGVVRTLRGRDERKLCIVPGKKCPIKKNSTARACNTLNFSQRWTGNKCDWPESLLRVRCDLSVLH